MIRLVVFDADGTLTEHSSIWWRLHQVFGTTEEGKRFYDMFFAGEISYDEWAELDAALWRGQPLEAVMQVVHDTRLVLGAQETVRALHRRGIKTAILSGGLDVLADDVARRLGVPYVVTNRLIHHNGILTGEVETRVGWNEKADIIKQIAADHDVTLAETAFVGDGRNDVGAMSVVGLAIAFRPEHEDVAKVAHVVVSDNDLRAILPYIISSDP